MLLSIFAVLLLAASAAGSGCPSTCRFRLCDRTASFHGGRADTARTSAICLSGTHVGVVNTGEARVNGQPISRWSPPGLLQPFAAQFVKAYSLLNAAGSGVGTQRPQQNQAAFAVGRCFRLPIIDWEALGGNGSVVANVRGSDPEVDCVALRLLAPKCPIRMPGEKATC